MHKYIYHTIRVKQQLAIKFSITKTIQKEKVQLQHLQPQIEGNTPLHLMITQHWTLDSKSLLKKNN